MRVGVIFTAAAAGSAAVWGFASGLPGLWLPPPGPDAAFAVLGGAVLLDAAGARWGQARPPSVRRQVPVAWSRLFAPPVVALLYGARLGVGPLTILPTWLWWGAWSLGAWLGPLPGIAVGLAFAVARAGTTLGLGAWLHAHAAPRMAWVRRRESAAATGLSVLLGAAAALAWLGS